jgi:hypothetical protein
MTDGLNNLTDHERAILDFERSWSSQRGSKAVAVDQRFGLSLATYYRRRGKLIMRPEAFAYAPALVRRLRSY